MNTKTAIVLTGFVAIAVLAATMAMKALPVYAPGGQCVGCAAPFAPAHREDKTLHQDMFSVVVVQAGLAKS